MGEVDVVFAQKRARLFSLLLYHLLSRSTLPFWTIFFGVLSPILRRKRRASCAPVVKALRSRLRSLSCACCASAQARVRRVPDPRQSVWSHREMKGKERVWRQASHLFYRKWGM